MGTYKDQVYKVVNIVNNNIVTVKDFNGHELIAIGKGLGFKKKKNDFVYKDEILKSYILVDKNKKSILSLAEEIPFDVIEISEEIISLASKKLDVKYNINLLISLADHINFSIKEYKKGNIFPKLVNEEIKRFYKDEYEVGLEAIDIINRRFDICLFNDEASSIAFHLITASEAKSNDEMFKTMKYINEIITIVEKHLNTKLDENILAYSRFVIHLKFFIKKIMSNEAIDNDVRFTNVLKQLITRYQEVRTCMNEVSNYVLNNLNYHCTDEDCIYLMIHIVRLYEVTKGEKNVKN